MKTFIYISTLLFSSVMGAQNVFFNTGVNMTTYDYSNSSGENNNNIQPSNGAFYEMGYGIPINFSSRGRGDGRYSRLKIKISLTLNEYNATGGNSFDNYDWQTQYLGLRTNLEYFILDTDFFTVALDGGVGVELLLNGKQKIGGTTYNLKDHDEFKSIFITPKLGLNLVYNINEAVGLSGGFNLSKAISAKLKKSSVESVSFNNSQFIFGISLQIY